MLLKNPYAASFVTAEDYNSEGKGMILDVRFLSPFDSTKKSYLKVLEVAIDVLKSCIAQPFALSLNWRQDIGSTVSPVCIFDLLSCLGSLMKCVHGIVKGIIKHSFNSVIWRKYMLKIYEDATGI
mmetsp:Transcript_512/g.662  ORF Transcript_512/g.662 Transcript_512/m.662 type:complete len:125 (+) Transcript_512:116-490(+)